MFRDFTQIGGGSGAPRGRDCPGRVGPVAACPALCQAGPGPGIERLAAIRTAAVDGEPLIFVYGPGTDDAFVDASYRICEIEECLWEVLRDGGLPADRVLLARPEALLS